MHANLENGAQELKTTVTNGNSNGSSSLSSWSNSPSKQHQADDDEHVKDMICGLLKLITIFALYISVSFSNIARFQTCRFHHNFR